MSDWFTVEPIDADTYAISEYRHWEETHCYLLLGTDTALLIDTGLGVADLRRRVERLTDLPVLVTTTHAHWDHIGGHRLFDRFCLHEAEVPWVTERFPLPLSVVKKNLLDPACPFPPEFDPDGYQIFRGQPTRVLHDLDRIDLGRRCLTVLHTPGHSPGHCCFYEEERGTLYTGDLVYQGCLDAFYPTTDPGQFLQSLTRIDALPADRILPGHHRLSIPPTMVHDIQQGFLRLQEEGKLTQGAGLFTFPHFQIHL